MPIWVETACDDYLQRINRGKYQCKIIEIKSPKAPNKPVSQIKSDEATKFAEYIPRDAFVIMLDERGVDFGSLKLAAKLDSISLTNSHICFIIGGADGLDDQFKTRANMLIKLSSLTFPHALVRVILLEQIYRVISILENHPYHRE